MFRFLLVCLFSFTVFIHGQEAALKEGFVEVENAKLFYRSTGKGAPLIVLHGGPGLSQDYLLPGMYPLADNNLVIFYDQRGCGQSTGEISAGTITLEKYIADLDKIRKSFNFNKISILGHSWGGFLAMQYAIAHPENVEKLILLSTAPASTEDLNLVNAESTKRMAPYSEELSAIASSDLFLSGDPETVAKWLKIGFRTYMYKSTDINKLNLCRPKKAALNGFKVHAIFLNEVFMKPFNLFQELSKLQCPALIILGDTDPTPVNTAEHIKNAILHSKLSVIENCGHFPYVERPEILFKTVDEFLHPSAAE